MFTRTLEYENKFIDIGRHTFKFLRSQYHNERMNTVKRKGKKDNKNWLGMLRVRPQKGNRKKEWKRSRKPESDWGKALKDRLQFFL